MKQGACAPGAARRQGMSDRKQKKDERGEPQWHPITMLPMIAMAVDGQVKALEEGYGGLKEAREKPYVLDDATVNRTIKVHEKTLDDAWVFEEQLARWSREELDGPQRQEVERLTGQMAKRCEICRKVIELAQELKKGTIDRIMRMSDKEVAMAVMMGKLKLPK